MRKPNKPNAVTEAFAARVAELKERLTQVLDQRAATERELTKAQNALERVQHRISEICAEEGHLRSQVADAERALQEARKLQA